MSKNYKRWHEEKTAINDTEGAALFHEREVWWCMLGVNVGCEQDGGKNFERPVIIIKKFNLDACLIVPLTGHLKHGKYYFPVGKVKDRDAIAVLSQLRFIDRKRLVNKICMLDERRFQLLRLAVNRANLSP